MGEWPVKDAKSRFSELIEKAETEGPQLITKHGAEKAVVLSVGAYRKLAAAQPDFRAYLLSGPRVADFEIDRSRERGRAIDL